MLQLCASGTMQNRGNLLYHFTTIDEKMFKTFLRHYDLVILVHIEVVCFGGQQRIDGHNVNGIVVLSV